MFAKYDLHPKTKDEYSTRTLHGAAVSMVAVVIAVVLLYSELKYSLKTEVVDHLYVNSSSGGMLPLHFNITFPSVPCEVITCDVEDSAGDSKSLDLDFKIMKVDLDEKGKVLGQARAHEAIGGTLKDEEQLASHDAVTKKFKVNHMGQRVAVPSDDACGDCYGAGEEGECCNTCAEVMSAYGRKGWAFDYKGIPQCEGEEILSKMRDFTSGGGCNIWGNIEVPMGGGNLHFAMLADAMHYHATHQLSYADLLNAAYSSFNITHRVHAFAVGEKLPGIKNPLDGRAKHIDEGHGIYQYYLKVVPTSYLRLDGQVARSNQYSVTEHLRQVVVGSNRGLPGVYFFYEMSAIQAQFEERRPGIFVFLTSALAIIGGIFTVMGFFDSAIYTVFSKNKGAAASHTHKA